MSVNVSGDNSLHWEADIGTDNFEKSVTLIIKGLKNTADTAVDMAKAQNDAFSSTDKTLQGVASTAKKMESAFEGFKKAKQHVTELTAELAKMKTPEFLSGKSGKELDSLNKYIKQQEELLIDLQATTADYAKDLVNLSKLPITAPVVEAPQVEAVSVAVGGQVIDELKKAFGEIDAPTQKFIQDLISLELELQNLSIAQRELDDMFNQGRLAQEDYADASSFLVAGIAQVNDKTEALTNKQTLYEASLKASTGSIDQKKEALGRLSAAYTALSEAERSSPEGKNLAKQVGDLKLEIKGLEPGKIENTKNALVNTQTALNKLVSLMAANPNSPLFETWKKQAAELKENLKSVKLDVEQATNSTAGVEAFATGLRGLVGGFTAATGVVGLFTDNTEQYEQVTKNAASALALLNGIQEVSNVLSKNGALNVYLLGLMRKSSAAATLLQTGATEINTVAAGANIVATEAQAVATTGAAVAQRGMAAAMLANPAGLVIAGIAAIAGAYLLLRGRTSDVKNATDLLAEANKKVNNTYAEKMAKLLPLLAIVKEGNLSEADSIELHKQLAEIDVKLVKGLNDKSLAYEKLQANVNAYGDSLRKQYRLEANQSAIQESIKNEELLRGQIEKTNAALEKNKKNVQKAKATASTPDGLSERGQIELNILGNESEIKKKTEALKQQTEVTNKLVLSAAELSKTTAEKGKRGTEAIDKDISALRRQQAQVAQTSKEYQDFENKIIELEKERKNITGASKQEIKAAISAETKAQREYAALLNEQKGLLEAIDGLKRDSKQSGLTKEASELDRINEKYDLALIKIADFNKKAPKELKIDANPVNQARASEVQNQIYKDQAKEYKKTLDSQQKAFEDYEQAKLDVGEEKAKQLFAAQTAGSAKYIDYLIKQKAEVEKSVPIGPTPLQDNGQILKSAEIDKKIAAEREKLAKEAIDKEIEGYKTLIQATVTYNEEKLAINKKYDALEVELEKDKLLSPQVKSQKKLLIEAARAEELTGVENNLARQSELYKTLNADLVRYTKEQLAERLALLKKFIQLGYIIEKDGSKTVLTPQMKADLEEGIKKAEGLNNSFDKTFNTLKQIGELGDVFSQLGETYGSSTLSEIGAAISGIAGQLGNLEIALSKLTDENKQAKIQAGIQAAVSLITIVVEGAKRRREAVEQYYASAIQLQRDYNLSINDQIRLQSQLKANVFVKDYEGKMLDGIKAAHNANENYQKALAELAKGRAKDGMRNAVSWGSVGRGAASGAAIGAAVGTVVPVIGNVIGAVIGGLVGAIVGLFGGKKKKDVFVDLLGKYPEIITKMADGTEKFNSELAASLIKNNQVDEATKGILNNIIEWDKKLQAAREQIKGVVSELAGSLGDDLRNSLVKAFQDGTSSAKAFGDSVNKVLENIISNLLFNQVFSKSFDELQKRMEKSFDLGGDSSWVDDIAAFFEGAPGLIEQFNAALGEANAQSKLRGLNVFAKTNTLAQEGNSLQGAIKGITQQQADLLAGQFGGLRMTAFEQLNVAKFQLNQLNQIALNTSQLYLIEGYLRYFRTVGIKVI